MWRLLHHARSCDGVKRDDSGKLVACSTCSMIDRRLEDGSAYLAEDPAHRLEAIDKALVAILAQQQRLAAAVETSSLPHSARAASYQLLDWVARTRTLLTLPITEIPGYDRHRPPPQPRRRPVPPKPERPKRTAVVIVSRKAP